MWKKIPVPDETLASDLARELESLTDEERAKVLGYLSHDREIMFLNEHASAAFSDTLEGLDTAEDIDAPSADDLSTFHPLFTPRFKVS